MSVHNDTLQGLQEALEYARGNLPLNTSVVEIPDEEIIFYSIYAKLSESNKAKLISFATELLRASNT